MADPPRAPANRPRHRGASQSPDRAGGAHVWLLVVWLLVAVLHGLRGAADHTLGALLPCPACGIRPGGRAGCCPTCRRRACRPGIAGHELWLGPYLGPLGRAVRALKYRGAARLAGWLGDALATEVVAAGWRPTMVCPVPLHSARHRRRGYNQAALLAKRVAFVLEVPYRPVLRRTRPTPSQARLSREARRANVARAFASGPARGASVLLVDDVVTTGATAAACREALLSAGAREVRLAVVARSERSAPAIGGRAARRHDTSGRAWTTEAASERALQSDQRETSRAVVIPTTAPTRT